MPIRACCIVILLLILGSQDAWAGLTLMGGAGATAGTVTKSGSPLVSKGYSYALQVSYVPTFSRKPWPLVLGAQIKQLKLNFTEGAVKKRATYNLYGAHAGLSLMLTPTFCLQVMGEYYGDAKISVLSTHQVRLNGSNYKYSSWEQYTGPAAVGARLQLSHDKIDGQFSASNRYRSGVGLSLVQQSFNKESTQITTSNDDLAPEQAYTQSDVSYRVMLISIDLFIGLTF